MEKVKIHFHSGASATAIIGAAELEAENERLAEYFHRALEADESVENAEELVETAFTVPPKPRWTWVGDVFLFTQAVCGVEVGVAE